MLVLGTGGMDNRVMQEVVAKAQEIRLGELRHLADYQAGKTAEIIGKMFS